MTSTVNPANYALQATTYTKTEVDNKDALKADAATTYNKTEVDNKDALKAAAATTYNNTEVDTDEGIVPTAGKQNHYEAVRWILHLQREGFYFQRKSEAREAALVAVGGAAVFAVWRKVNSVEHKYAPVKTQEYHDEVNHHGKLAQA